MVKKKTARQKIREKNLKKETRDEDPMVQDAASEWSSEAGGTSASERASVKRKMAKQIRFLNKLEETQRVLSAQKKNFKKKRKSQKTGRALNDLSSLSEFLPSITASTTTTTSSKVLRSKAKQTIVTNETKQLAAVLSHPQFKANPFAAIQQHLTTTLPPPLPVPNVKVTAKAGSKKKK
ncbi:uncharacterized protein [Physcomitrium patens]|uniref:Ribosome biogenesis protein SLX9 n=1 Tax=Physcomitrium patens TaxID=3218 RepID=A0A2K1IQG1_PHYPA|nr:putative ribosome biogenesis protein slx9-like isoform X1 [Physcomitrium patens]PNR31515.1 hypothetical protein PHYPA_025636 [Physcomitrium patens]|eukprot:XP_024359792.1 putative ribosome biogenesis protein slx9-like isoform X1 [Physcomitrella patens]